MVSVSAQEVNLEVTSGDDEAFVITRKDADGNLKDITGWTFWMTVKKTSAVPDSEAAVQKKVTSHTDPTNGETEITLTAADTADLSGSYQYDMQYKTSGGDVKTFMIGTIHVDDDITEDT